MGRGGQYARWGRENNTVGVGWITGDITDKSLDQVTKIYKSNIKDKEKLSELQIKIGMNQLFKFAYTIKVGDIILVPDTHVRKIYIGKVESEYFYINNPHDGCDYPHRRNITWLKEVKRDDLSTKFKFAMGALTAVFSVNHHANEIEQLITGTEIIREEEKINESITQRILNRLYNFDGREFEQFITYFLNTIGLEAAVTQYVADKGVDVIGTINAEGLANVTCRIQVKRVSGTIGIEEVQRIRGTLSSEEHGTIISLSNFSKSAIKEAEDPTKKPVVLIDGEYLVDLILEHFDELDEPYQKLLGVKPRKLSVEEKFNLV